MNFTNIKPEDLGTASKCDFFAAIIKEEAVANFAAMNKIRESLLVAMTKAMASGNDGTRFITALDQIHKQVTLAQQELKTLLGGE